MLGREVNHPADLMYSIGPTRNDTEADYIAELEGAIHTAHEVARETLKSSQSRMKRDYDLKVHLHSYKIGDCVYILDTAIKKGTSKKLAKPWKGPGIILKMLTPYLFRVKLQRTIVTVHHDRITLCQSRQLPSWINRYKTNLEKNDENQLENQDSDKVYCHCLKPDDTL